MRADLSGKVSVVTGAGQGIGKAIALTLAQNGSDVAVFDINADTAAKTADEVRKLGRKASSHTVDVTDFSRVQDHMRAAAEELGGVDILVNDAGLLIPAPFREMSEELWDRHIAVNLKSCFNCIHAAVEYMAQKKWGRIISMSSVAGRMGAMAGRAHYGTAKAGVVGLTFSLAKEFGPLGITVNAIAPGAVITDMGKGTISGLGLDIKNFPVGRFGQPQDVANVVLMLASKDSEFINGEVINVNGGFWMG